MNQNSQRKRKVVGIVSAGALVLSLGVGSFSLYNLDTNAATTSTVTTQTEVKTEKGGLFGGRQMGQKQDRGVMGQRGGQSKFDSEVLVTEGLISTEQATVITDYLTTKSDERTAEREKVTAMTTEERTAYFEAKALETRTTLLEELVTSGTLTQAEADQITAYRDEARLVNITERMTTSLASLVTDGTLTAAEVEDIIAYLAAQEPKEKGPRVQGTTEEARISPFDAMVTEGTLTQAQVDAIQGVIGQRGHSGRGQMGGRR
jgi:polyhydroxyalkanoate synthesis regulator phasin